MITFFSRPSGCHFYFSTASLDWLASALVINLENPLRLELCAHPDLFIHG
jgi:hypothetical protein